jgi:hypothetical protein
LPQGLIVCTCRVKKKEKRGKKQRLKEKKKERGGNPNVFCERFPFTFLPKNTLPYQVWGGCNEEETVRDKERKERKQSKAKKAKKRRDTRQKTKENKRLTRDRQTCGTFTPALLWLLIIYL